nr:MBL fold metallo-hydrolase [Micromonospora sp. DSM 115978]
HSDHTFAVAPVCGAKGIPAYIHPADRSQLTDPWSAIKLRPGTPLFGRLEWSEPDDVRDLTGSTTLSIAGLELRIDSTPGHTPGSVTFASSDTVSVGSADGTRDLPVLFSGDLLFAGSIGRTDFPGGSFEAIMESLGRVVLPLP